MSAAQKTPLLRHFLRSQSGKVSLSWLFATACVLAASSFILTTETGTSYVPLDAGLGAGVDVERLPAHGIIADPFTNQL